MNKKKFELAMAEYINGEISAEREAELRAYIRKRGLDPALPDDCRRVFRDLDDPAVPVPGDRMTVEFRSMLDEAKRDLRKKAWDTDSRPPGWRRFVPGIGLPGWASALGLILIGALLGAWWSPFRGAGGRWDTLMTEVRSMKKAVVLAMLDNPSASERMKAVHIAREAEELDDEMIQALLRTLNGDPNVNLRLAAAESLAGQAGNPAVRRGLADAIDRQESPLVQLALADILLDLGEKSAAPSLDRLLQRRDLDFGVKRRLEAVRSQIL